MTTLPPTRMTPPQGAETRLDPGLYLVSTPIGSLRDITLRALDVLGACDAILCEDTRTSGVLLAHYGIKTPRLACHDHNEQDRIPAIIDRIRGGASLALITDAGTPLVSDPGWRVVQSCLQAGIMITSVPGANAVLPALQLSGLRTDCFAFAGFLPTRQSARRRALERWIGFDGTVLFYESPRRLIATLDDAYDVLGDCPAAIIREITKKFEEARRGSLGSLIAFYTESAPPRGEIVLVIDPGAGKRAADQSMAPADLDSALRAALAAGPLRVAVDQVAAATRQPRRAVYARALALREETNKGAANGEDGP